jgi:transaldolase
LKLYLDSAQVSDWVLPVGCPPVVGVTTNPSLVFQAGLPVTLATYLHLLQAAGEHGLAELMLQLPSSDPVQALQWLGPLREAAGIVNVCLTIKLPCHPDWLPCIEAVQQVGQAVLLTGLSNPVQLLWAQSLGVAYVAPYVGRLAADGRDVWALMDACVAVQGQGPSEGAGLSAVDGLEQGSGLGSGSGPALLAASIKSPDVLARLLACGAAAATLPPPSLIAWRLDALTQNALEQFDRDVASSLSLLD